MPPRRHWADRLVCQCGMAFRTVGQEAIHRHAFPRLCRKPREHKPRPRRDHDGDANKKVPVDAA